MAVRLLDGTRVSFRPIEPGDGASLAAGLRLISLESARRRFGTAKPTFSPAELRYLTEVDGVEHVALVAVRADSPQTLMAVGRFVRWPEDPDAAEIAIVVGDPWQRQGLGTALGLELAAAARAVGVRRWTASVLEDNLAAKRLLLALGGDLLEERHQLGMSELVLGLAAQPSASASAGRRAQSLKVEP